MVSTISGPIPSHPMYEFDDFSVKSNNRTRPEAREIALKGQGSISSLLEGLNINISQVSYRCRPTPKNYVQQNVKRMREIQSTVRKKNADSSKPMKALWKSGQYENVSSKVTKELQKTPLPPRPQSANYLRAHSKSGFYSPIASRPQTAETRSKSVMSNTDDNDLKLIRRDIDFVKLNGMTAKKMPMKRSPSLTALDDLKKKHDENEKNYQKGVVPNYLKERQKQWKVEVENYIASLPDPEMPVGHRQLSDGERKETLKKLDESRTAIQNTMSSLPIRSDTVRLQKQKAELNKQHAEIEEAIKIFERPKVFVKLDT